MLEIIIALFILYASATLLWRLIPFYIHLRREGIVQPGPFSMWALEREFRQKNMDDRRRNKEANK